MVVAVLIGGIELLGLIGEHWKAQGVLWDTVAALNDHFGLVGFLVIGVFVATWIASLLIYRWNRYDHVKLRADLPA